MPDAGSIIDIFKRDGLSYINLWFVDVSGGVKSIIIPAERIEEVLERGVLFDGSSLEGVSRSVESELLLVPDVKTFAILPWDSPEERVGRLICQVHTPHGEPYSGDPRRALQNVLNQAQAMGYSFRTGVELEFFLFQLDDHGVALPAWPHDSVSYFDLSTNFRQSIRRKMVATLTRLGMSVISSHHEIGSGQHEINFGYEEALTTADQVLTARVALKSVAQHNNLHCTFMPRPRRDLPGSGMHTHQSLHSTETCANLFGDSGHEYGLSEIGRWFLAGQLHHARAMVAVLAPLVNSYKRLGTSIEAPVYVTWAHINRAALIRVPGLMPDDGAHTRLELRCPDPSSNPYLAAAVMLAAGLDGIRQKMPLPEPLEEDLLGQDRARLRRAKVLPATLEEALLALEADETILSALGPYISNSFLASRREEVEDFNRQVTDWEMERYFQKY